MLLLYTATCELPRLHNSTDNYTTNPETTDIHILADRCSIIRHKLPNRWQPLHLPRPNYPPSPGPRPRPGPVYPPPDVPTPPDSPRYSSHSTHCEALVDAELIFNSYTHSRILLESGLSSPLHYGPLMRPDPPTPPPYPNPGPINPPPDVPTPPEYHTIFDTSN